MAHALAVWTVAVGRVGPLARVARPCRWSFVDDRFFVCAPLREGTKLRVPDDVCARSAPLYASTPDWRVTPGDSMVHEVDLERRSRHSAIAGIVAIAIAALSFVPCLWMMFVLALLVGIVALERGVPCLAAIPERDPSEPVDPHARVRRSARIGVTCGSVAIAFGLLFAGGVVYMLESLSQIGG